MIGLHAAALFLAFMSGGVTVLSFDAEFPQERRVCLGAAVLCALASGGLFTLALVLR